jgi:hypothetical protein
MTDYTITTDFGAKDSLPSGNAAKIIKGSEFTTEFTNIKTAVNSKADTAGDTFTGAVTFDAAVTLNADVTFDTNTMFVDVSENRVGINTTSPAQKLDVNGNIRVQGTYPKIEFVDTDNNSDFTLINGNGAFLVYDETNSSERMRIDSSGSIGIGTTSPDTLLELVGADPILTIRDSETTGANTNATLRLAESGASDTLGNYWDINHTGNGELRFVQDRDGVNNERMRINYAGNVGIGTTNPTVKLDVETQATGDVASFTGAHPSRNLLITNYTSGGDGSSYAINANSGFGELKLQTVSKDRIKIAANGDISFYEDTGTTAQLFWDASAESLGIGTDSPNYKLVVSRADVGTLARFQTEDGTHNPELDIATTSTGVKVRSSFSTGIAGSFDISTAGGQSYITFNPNDSEAMRIDKSGNVMVGKTSSGSTIEGAELHNSGSIFAVRDSNPAGAFDRKTTDGDVVQFRRDGTTVGSIGIQSSGFYIDGEASHSGLRFGSGAVVPRLNGSDSDNTADLGESGIRFQDIYATNGTIQTSDRNEKQGIRELLDAEQRVATACKGLLRAFKWNSAVEEKGDEARIHFGIIAQDLQDAFTAEGLDAGDYAMFINSTWTDEETGEERSRMGVRYSELLAFIISAI